MPTMTMLTQLRSFARRRISIPATHDWLVLDVGSGDKPHWRADVLLDRYAGEEHAVQRSGGAGARITRPLFDADAADMPFADQVFDYVICSHVLEHVPDPGAVIEEMMRVAKAGYIEVPDMASAKIVDFPSHVWWCSLVDGTLVFTAKEHPYFDADIDRFLDDSGLRRPLADLLDSHLDHRVVELPWQGTVPYRVDGTVSEELLASAHEGEFKHRSGQTLVTRALTTAFVLPRRGDRRRDPVAFNDIVRPHLRRADNPLLRPQIYRFGDEQLSEPTGATDAAADRADPTE